MHTQNHRKVMKNYYSNKRWSKMDTYDTYDTGEGKQLALFAIPSMSKAYQWNF